ncbi:hypothetical protein LOD44_10665, partial [Xylella fastidiosa subsp. multiplex]
MGDLKTMQVSLDLYIRLVSLLTEHHYLSLCHQIRWNLFERQIFLPFGIELILLYGNLSPSPHDTRNRRHRGKEISKWHQIPTAQWNTTLT